MHTEFVFIIGLIVSYYKPWGAYGLYRKNPLAGLVLIGQFLGHWTNAG